MVAQQAWLNQGDNPAQVQYPSVRYQDTSHGHTYVHGQRDTLAAIDQPLTYFTVEVVQLRSLPRNMWDARARVCVEYVALKTCNLFIWAMLIISTYLTCIFVLSREWPWQRNPVLLWRSSQPRNHTFLCGCYLTKYINILCVASRLVPNVLDLRPRWLSSFLCITFSCIYRARRSCVRSRPG